MSTLTEPPAVELELDEYPSSDGKPLGETFWHVQNIIDMMAQLQQLFGSRNVLFGSNQFLYYEKNNRRRHVSPDIYITLSRQRPLNEGAYFLWLVGTGPDVVIEFTSRTARDEDLVDKFKVYRDIVKVGEYFLFDPHAEYLPKQLMGYRLIDGKYVEIMPVDGRLPSQKLGVHLQPDGPQLWLWDPKIGQTLRSMEELEERAAEAEAESRARREAEAEVARLREELHRLRGG